MLHVVYNAKTNNNQVHADTHSYANCIVYAVKFLFIVPQSELQDYASIHIRDDTNGTTDESSG